MSSSSLNKVLLIGRIGNKLEKRMLPLGDVVVTFALATSYVSKDKKTGERKESVEWHTVTLFYGLADIAIKYLEKGNQVYVEGQSLYRQKRNRAHFLQYLC